MVRTPPAVTGATVLHVAAVEFTATRLLAPQLNALMDSGYDVRLACTPDASGFDPQLARFRPAPVSFPRAADIGGIASALAQLRRTVAEIRPDAIHFHSPAAAIPGRVGLLLRRPDLRVVYTVHGFLHQWDAPTLRDRVLERAERLLSRRTDLLFFQSGEDFEAASRHRYRGRLRYLGNGVQESWFTGPRSDLGRQPIRQLLYVGRLSREKGVLDLLEAVRQTPGVELTMIGAALTSDRDDVTAQCRDFVQQHALAPRVRLTGMLDPEEVRQRLTQADAFVLPSWREGMPRSIIEAMAAGLPVVTTAIRGCRELVSDGVHGWIVPPRDPGALAVALAKVVRCPSDDLARIGARSFQKVGGGFREQNVYERLVNGYVELGLRGAA